MVSIRHALSFTVSMASLLVACGEKVVVDDGASGGGGAAAASTSSTTGPGSAGGVGGAGSTGGAGSAGGAGSTGSTGGAGGCEGLESDFLTKLGAAQGCNPALSVPQCNGSVTAQDTCGCSVVANDTSSAAAKMAVAAFDAWVGGGCGPTPCLVCPPPPPAPWYCDPTDSVCKPLYIK